LTTTPNNPKTVPLGYLATVVGTMGSCAYFGFVFLITKYSYRLNVVFGLCCSLVLTLVGLILVGFGYQFIRESQNRAGKRVLIPILEKIVKQPLNTPETRAFEISFFVPVVTLFLASWTSLAYGIARLNPAAYAHPDRLSFWLMFQHYLWQSVDMVPLIEAWKQVHIEDPIIEKQLWPGILVIIFRSIVLYVVLSAAATLFGFDKRNKGED
jgi:hypothetical protein